MSYLGHTDLTFIDRVVDMNRRYFKVIIFVIALISMLALTACGGAKVPKDYNYDDFSKYIKLGDYKGIAYTKTPSEVTDEELQKYIESALQKSQTKQELKEGTVQGDSVVNIDYVGKVDGKKFDGGTAEGVELNIAKNSFIEGFASAIIGHNVGEKFDIEVTFPENYSNRDLAGKPAVFTIKLNAIVQTKEAEFNDEFVKKNSKFNNTEEYKANAIKLLTKNKKAQAEAMDKQNLFNKITQSSKVKKYPEAELKERREQFIKTYKDSAKSAKLTYKKYIRKNFGIGVKEFEKQAKEQAKQQVAQELVIYALADKLDIKLDRKAYNEELNSMLKKAGYTKKTYKKATGTSIEDYANEKNLYVAVLYDKVMDKVMDKAKAN